MFAFLAASAAVRLKKSDDAAKTKQARLPIFEPRWWFSKQRLDARPVIWSLLNHPEEWTERSVPGLMFHLPSRHEFRLYSKIVPLGLLHAQCSCHTDTTNHFQHFQRRAVIQAWRQWSALDRSAWKSCHEYKEEPVGAYIGNYEPDHFTAHFVH